MTDTDPGWKPAIKASWRILVPGGARAITRRRSPLETTRMFAAGGVLMWIVFGGLIAIANHDLHPTKGTIGVAAFGALDVFWIYTIARRQLPAPDAKTVRAYVIQTFFVGFALVEATVLLGFVAFFVARRGQLLLYLTSLVLAYVGLTLIAPSKLRLEQIQERMGELGSTESVIEILSRPPDVPPARPKRRRRR